MGEKTWRRPEEIRGEIEQTRAELTETMREIKERLSAGHLKSESMERLREATVGRLKTGMTERTASILCGSPAARKVAYNALTAAFFGASFGRHLFGFGKSDGRPRPGRAGTEKASKLEFPSCRPSSPE